VTREVPLRGLISAAVRAGQTVRRPAVPAADALLSHLAAAGFSGAPRYLGRDGQGRSMLSWIDGWCPGPGEEHLVSVAAVRAVGALLRRYHDAVAGYQPPAGAPFPEGPRTRSAGQLVCHGDVAPRNTVFRDGMPVAFIDWDGAWISDPLWDVGYAIWQFAPLRDDAALLAGGWPEVPDRLARAAALADGYRLDGAARRALPASIAPMIHQCAASIEAKARAGQPAFARLAAERIPAAMHREARWAAAQQPALRARLLAT
jgi:Ser/Thr protein kinase RdoA (MazF antagonist)